LRARASSFSAFDNAITCIGVKVTGAPSSSATASRSMIADWMTWWLRRATLSSSASPNFSTSALAIELLRRMRSPTVAMLF
jgi:hypothetical protein